MKPVRTFVHDFQGILQKFKKVVSPEIYFKAMTILDYYTKRRFNRSKYHAGVDEDPVVEITKAVLNNSIKCLFVLSDADDLSQRFVQTEVSAYPPYYLPVERFHDEMSILSHSASEDIQRQAENKGSNKAQSNQAQGKAKDSMILFVCNQNYYDKMISVVFECIFGYCLSTMEKKTVDETLFKYVFVRSNFVFNFILDHGFDFYWL